MNGTKSSEEEAWRMIKSYAVAGAHDSSVINRMMLRFRPIAPKPATRPDVPGGSSAGEKYSSLLSTGRRKRKYVRVRRNSGYTRKKNPKPSREEDRRDEITRPRNDDALEEQRPATTLQLLPESSIDLSRPVELDLAVKYNTAENRGPHTCSIWENPAGSTEANARVLVVRSLVTVESVTGITCIAAENNDGDRCDDQMIGTDAERLMSLERDTCPGFVSDGSNSVVWVNGAFKRMVTKQQEMKEGVEIVVGLVIKEGFPSVYSDLTGHVKLQYYSVHASGVETDRYSRVVPCDLWRMDGGGFAWRLDVEAALTLGRT